MVDKFLPSRLEYFQKKSTFKQPVKDKVMGFNIEVPDKPSRITFKVYKDAIKIKLRKDLFIFVTDQRSEALDKDRLHIYIKDTIVNGVKIQNKLLYEFSKQQSFTDLLIVLERFINNPTLALKVIVKRADPLVVGKYKQGNRYIKTEDGERVNAFRASQIKDLKKAGVDVVTGATIPSSLLR